MFTNIVKLAKNALNVYNGIAITPTLISLP